MPWDANWTTSEGVGKLTRRSYNQLQAAIEERSKGAGRSVVGSQLNKYQRVTKSLRQALHNEVSNLIPLYVNHTLPVGDPGNYDGEDESPLWTEATILTAIGDATRETVPNDHLKCAKWNNQIRKIVNLLRWTMQTVHSEQQYYRGSGSQATWALAESVFNSASWAVLGGVKRLEFRNTNQYEKFGTKLYFTVNFPPTAAHHHDVFYVFCTTSTPGAIFLPWGNLDIYNKYNEFTTWGETGIVSRSFYVSAPDSEYTNSYPIPVGTKQNWGQQWFYISKFDGPNGFTYRGDDW